MDKKPIEISVELAQATVNYLATKPYSEVYQLIGLFHKAAQVKPEKEAKPEEHD